MVKLLRFALAAEEHRGLIPESEQESFLAAGGTSRHALDVLSILALKTLSNYTNHLAHSRSMLHSKHIAGARKPELRTRRHGGHGGKTENSVVSVTLCDHLQNKYFTMKLLRLLLMIAACGLISNVSGSRPTRASTKKTQAISQAQGLQIAGKSMLQSAGA